MLEKGTHIYSDIRSKNSQQWTTATTEMNDKKDTTSLPGWVLKINNDKQFTDFSIPKASVSIRNYWGFSCRSCGTRECVRAKERERKKEKRQSVAMYVFVLFSFLSLITFVSSTLPPNLAKILFSITQTT